METRTDRRRSGDRLGGIASPWLTRRCSTPSTIPPTCAACRPTSCASWPTSCAQETIDAVSVTGGHLGAGLGVVELTVALHHVFDTPHDQLVWDVGHQAYPHKILTGRRARIRTLRQPGGLSGFTKRSESEYDPFGAAHSSTSISAALGMATRARSRGRRLNVVAVIGDGAMSAGMAYEAMNNAGAMNARLIVILNDNDMSIAPATGAMHDYLSRVISSQSYMTFRHVAKQLAGFVPRPLAEAAEKAEEYARGMVTGGTLFEELGFYYIGPLDGHNLDHLLPVLKNVRDAKRAGPGPDPRAHAQGRGLSAGRELGRQVSRRGQVRHRDRRAVQEAGRTRPSYTSVFAKALIKEAEADPEIVAITAAMPIGTGVGPFAKHFPERAFDVGIAEQHAVTFAAGPRDPGLPAVLRDLLDLPAARLRPGGARRRDPGPAGALRDGPRRPGRRRRADPCRRVRRRLSRLPARLRDHGRRRRGRADAHGRDHGADRRPAVGGALSARRGRRPGRCPSAASRSRSARAGSCARAAARSRCCRSARACRNA